MLAIKKVIISCDKCGKLMAKKICRIKPRNFCSVECRDAHNSVRMTIYNWTQNPENQPGQTIEQRAARRERAKRRSGGTAPTKHFGMSYHRAIMEAKLGRPLQPDEVVHHIDGNHENNKPNNLEVMDRREHARWHMKQYWAKKKGGGNG